MLQDNKKNNEIIGVFNEVLQSKEPSSKDIYALKHIFKSLSKKLITLSNADQRNKIKEAAKNDFDLTKTYFLLAPVLINESQVLKINSLASQHDNVTVVTLIVGHQRG